MNNPPSIHWHEIPPPFSCEEIEEEKEQLLQQAIDRFGAEYPFSG